MNQNDSAEVFLGRLQKLIDRESQKQKVKGGSARGLIFFGGMRNQINGIQPFVVNGKLAGDREILMFVEELGQDWFAVSEEEVAFLMERCSHRYRRKVSRAVLKGMPSVVHGTPGELKIWWVKMKMKIQDFLT